MTGVNIVGALLGAHAATLALVPASSIKAGRLPEDAELDAILVRLVSSTDRQPLAREQYVRRTDRVAVTVRAKSYRRKGAIIEAVRNCLMHRTGDIGGALRVSILSAGLGPDIDGPGNSFEQTQDFRVSFDAEYDGEEDDE